MGGFNEKGELLDPAEEQAAFFMHFGRFVWQFSRVEKLCHFVFHHHFEIGEKVARAIIGGEQLSKVTKVLTAASKAKGDTKAIAEMQALVDQINVISQLRHDLVHRGAETKIDGTFDVTNRETAKSIENTEILRLNLGHLKDATADLIGISIRLAFFPDPAVLQKMKDVSPYWYDIACAPWRYKRVEPDKPHQPSRSIPQ